MKLSLDRINSSLEISHRTFGERRSRTTKTSVGSNGKNNIGRSTNYGNKGAPKIKKTEDSISLSKALKLIKKKN